jgi:molybdopterin adenylyltransferase
LGLTIDTAGPAIAGVLGTELGAHVAWTALIPDEAEQIAATLKEFTERRVDLIITAGGTGIGPRDVTPEATLQVLDRQLPGLSEAMRAISAKATPNALLSRAVAGTRLHTIIVNVPGSKKAAVENLRAILSSLPHAIEILRNQGAHPEADKARLLTLDGVAKYPEPFSLSIVRGGSR